MNNYSQADITEFFKLLNKDIESLESEKADDFRTEIEYASKQINKGKDIKSQLKNIGGLMKDVGINVLANVIASPIYEIVKPHLKI